MRLCSVQRCEVGYWVSTSPSRATRTASRSSSPTARGDSQRPGNWSVGSAGPRGMRWRAGCRV